MPRIFFKQGISKSSPTYDYEKGYIIPPKRKLVVLPKGVTINLKQGFSLHLSLSTPSCAHLKYKDLILLISTSQS